MRVVALASGTACTSPWRRRRTEQWAPGLVQGVGIGYSALSDATVAGSTKRPEHLPENVRGITRGLARRGPPRFVLRDALALRSSGRESDRPGASPAPTRPSCPARLRQGDHALPRGGPRSAGYRYLAECATRYTPAVAIVPAIFAAMKNASRGQRPGGSQPFLRWTGSHRTGQYLRLVRAPLERRRKRYGFRFAVVVPVEFRASGVAVGQGSWDSGSKVQELLDLGVGPMPACDAEWEAGQGGLKTLVHFALGVPPLVRPVGANWTVVEDGMRGLLASPQDECVEELDRRLSSAALRSKIGLDVLRAVTREYSANVQGPRVAAILRETAVELSP